METKYTVRYSEHHWNGVSGTIRCASHQAAFSAARRIQSIIMDREQTADIEVIRVRDGRKTDYSIS